MSLTVGAVTKIVLDHVGGTKVSGNGSGIVINGTKIVVQGAGGGVGGILSKIPGASLAGALGSISSQISNTLDTVTAQANIASSLIKNPVGALSGKINGLTSGLLNHVTGNLANLPGAVGGQLQSSLGKLTSQLSSYTNHTNIVSGLVTDPTQFSANMLNIHQITSLSSSIPGLGDAATAAGALSASTVSSIQAFGYGNLLKSVGSEIHFDPQAAMASLGASSLIHGPQLLDEIHNSLDPTQPGGISGMINDIVTSNNPVHQEQLSAQVFSEIAKYNSIMNSHITTDIANQAQLQIHNMTVSAIGTYLPDTTNALSTLAFNTVSTPTLQHLQSAVNASVTASTVSSSLSSITV
jgi:hypothetical protein